MPTPPSIAPITGLTPEEQDIYKKLHDKVNKTTEKIETEEKKMSLEQQLTSWYKENMSAVRSFVS